MLSRLLRKSPSQNQPSKPSENQRTSKIVIGVPGRWHARTDVAMAMFREGYTLVDMIMMQTGTEKDWLVEIYDRDPNLRHAYQIAGRGLLDDGLLSEIDSHSFTVYVSSRRTSVEAAIDLGRVGCALLNSGGLAVKVESSGLAHSAADWRELTGSDNLYDLMKAFVTVVKSSTRFYSCGMHNFGFPDSSLGAAVDDSEAIRLLSLFNYYQLAQNPVLKEGETFDLGEDSPVYQLSKTLDRESPLEHLFHNANGRWHLTRIK